MEAKKEVKISKEKTKFSITHKKISDKLKQNEALYCENMTEQEQIHHTS